MPSITEKIANRFWAIVKQPLSWGECWVWTGSKTTEGYGRYVIDKKFFYAHRLSYEQVIGQIPEGLTIDHLCKNKSCVNPHHLEPVTMRENVLRSDSITAVCARKTHCPKGHPLSGDNLLGTALRIGKRYCKECHYAWQRNYSARRREANRK